MEVHKHPHHVTHKKKWGEYLLEFFMLFLAVFLGFVAENIREKGAEKQKEKEYIVSLIQDLRTDTSNLSNVITSYTKYEIKQDTIRWVLDSLDLGYNETFMSNVNYILGFPDFIYTDATMQQLKSSGGFRLIRNKAAVDSINAYSSAVNRTYINTGELNKISGELRNSFDEFVNLKIYHNAFKRGMTAKEMQKNKLDILIYHDSIKMALFYNKISRFEEVMYIIKNENFIPLKKQAIGLIRFLRKEYHLENE